MAPRVWISNTVTTSYGFLNTCWVSADNRTNNQADPMFFSSLVIVACRASPGCSTGAESAMRRAACHRIQTAAGWDWAHFERDPATCSLTGPGVHKWTSAHDFVTVWFINGLLRCQACSTYLVTLVVVGKQLWHPIDLCEDFNKQLGLVCRERHANKSRLISGQNAEHSWETKAHLPRDMELKVATICGLARASSLFFRASRWTHFSE